MPKVIFRKILSCPFILKKNTEGNLLSSTAVLIYAITLAIKTQRITRPRYRYAERVKNREREENENSENEVRSKKENKQRWRRQESREAKVA